MIPLKSVLLVLVFLSASYGDECDHSGVSGVVNSQHCLEEAHQDKKNEGFVESKQENENVFLNHDHIVESSSKTSLVEEVIESNGNGGIYEDRGSTTQYEKEDFVVTSLPSDAKGGGGKVYEEPPSKTREVLGLDHKEERETPSDQLENKNDTEVNHTEDKTDFPDAILNERPSASRGNVKSVEQIVGLESSDVRVDDFMKSRIAFTSAPSTGSVMAEKSPIVGETACSSKVSLDTTKAGISEKPKTEETPHEIKFDEIMDVNPPERLTMEETLGDDWKKDMPDEKETRKSSFQERFHSYSLNSQRYHLSNQPRALRLTMNENEELGEKETYVKSENDEGSFTGTEDLMEEQVQKIFTTDTTSSVITEKDLESTKSLSDSNDDEEIKEEINHEQTNNTGDLKTDGHSTTASVLNTHSQENDDSVLEKVPTAERFYAFNMEQENAEHNLNNGLETETRTENSIPRPFRDYEDKSDEDKVVIKSLLNDYPSFKKEKIEPGVLFEDCPDCDLRVLPIRPSEQRSTPNMEEEPLPSSTIRFAELPEGRELQINTLGLSDGIFLFSYLSDFLSLIQPNEFPVELLRDALRSQMSWISLITQSLQVEAGFVACMVVCVLLALAVPVVVLSHACYRMGGRQDDQTEAPSWGGNCKRRTLVFILQLLLILLFAGMIAMFATNEQLSSAVVQSSDVLQTSLNDISGFVHNSHLQLHFLVTQSLDQVVQAIYADLDNVDTLLGRPIQQELARETGLDVALDSLGDLTREAKAITQQVERFLDEARIVQEMLVSSREKLADLRQQVELFRRACGPRDRVLCDTIDSSGLDITFRLDRVKADERLNRMRRMGGVGLEAAAVEAKERFMSVPGRVEADTRDSREAVRRQLSRQRADVDERSRALEQFVREISSKVNEAKYQAGFWMQDLDQMEYWRWIVCMGGGAAVLMIWTMLLCSMCCGCCGSEKAAGPTILVTIVLLCLFSTALWTAAMVGLVVGGHGEVFLCRPLYDEPDFPSITRLVDEPGVFYSQPHGGFIANVIYGNDSLDVPIKQVLQDCKENRAIYPTLGLHRVFDAEAAVDQHRWGGVNSHVRAVKANLSALEVLSPLLQDQLQDLLATLSVNFTEHRIQMSKPVTGKDLDSFARQLDNIGNQMRDLATASRMETLSSRTRRLIDSHIRPLEGRKDALVYQLTALEVQTGPLQRQVNQSLSHLKTIQFFINSQGESIAHRKSREYVDRLLSYVEQLRRHVVESVQNRVSPCRPLWDVFNNSRLFLCRHTMDPLNGYWFATMWCMVVLLVATPVCLKLVDYYRAQGARASGSPTENLMISEQGAAWSSPGYDIKGSKEYSGDFK